MQRLNGCGARSLSNGPGTGLGREGIQLPHCTDSIGFLLAALRRRGSFHPRCCSSSPLYPPSGASSLRCNLALFESSLSFPLSRSRFISSSDFPSFTGASGELLAERDKGKRGNAPGKGRRRGGRGTRARLNIYLNGSAVFERD